MEPPALVIKSSIVNAILPSYLKNLFYTLFFLFPLLFLGILFSMLRFFPYSINDLVILYAVTGMVVAFFPLIALVVTYLNTEYSFYSDRVVREFRFFVVHQHTVMYAKITNVTLKVTLWDRLCNAGDLTLHTADDNEPDMRIEYIIGPERVQQQLYAFIQQTTHAAGVPSSGTLQSGLRAASQAQYAPGSRVPSPIRKTHIAPATRK